MNIATATPPELCAWLVIQFPTLNLDNVTLKFADPWTGSDGFTWGRSITLKPGFEGRLRTLEPGAVQLLCHELWHVRQFQQAGWSWLFQYLLNHRSWEAAAYQGAQELLAMWQTSTRP